MPDGEATFEDFCDGDGIIEPGASQDEPFTVRLRAIKKGDQLRVDFAGSDSQVAGPMNAPLSVTASGVYTTVKMVVDPTNMIPPNSGCWRPVTVQAPPGSVVNAQWPAPVVYANHEMSHRVSDMLFGALAEIVPDRVMACSQGTSGIFTLGGIDPRNGEPYVSYEAIKGGFGARPTKDGINCVASGIGNMMNTPIEVLEMSFPVRIEAYEVVGDSGGAGRYRGGCASRRVFRLLGAPAHAAVCCERTKSAPFGLFGAKPGAPGRVTLVDADGNVRELNSKGAFMVPAEGQVVYQVPGSGGYGPASQRDPERLRDDLINGYVSPQQARRDYGIDDPAAFLAAAPGEAAE
jgi:N-methylhydantoinase B